MVRGRPSLIGLLVGDVESVFACIASQKDGLVESTIRLPYIDPERVGELSPALDVGGGI